MKNICYRNIGCRLRSHYHCTFNCRIKHNNYNEKCEKYHYTKHLSKLKPKQNEIYKLMKQKYNFDDALYKYLENNLTFNKEEKIWLHDTFLSNKAITNKTSVEWIKTYLDICLKYRTCSVIFIMFSELFYPSYRYNYVMSRDKFIKMLDKKYMEFINYEYHKEFTELFKKHFFKPLLNKVLQLRNM